MGERKSGIRALGAPPYLEEEEDLDELLVERIRVFYQRLAGHLRELEAYKLKRGVCVGGISCTRKGVPNAETGKPGRVCAHHMAARKAGIKLRRWEAYESEYGRLRRQVLEAEREAASREKHSKGRSPKKVRSAA